MKKAILLSTAVCLLVSTSFVYGSDLFVPSTYPTIQAGIDAAVNGDRVVVDDGVYRGTGNVNLDFHGKAITVCSQNGPVDCKIDGQYNQVNGFYLHTGEGLDSVIDGFTLINCSGYGSKAIYCENASPTIQNCTINGCSYAILGQNSSVKIQNCRISGSGGRDGAITFLGGSPVVHNCNVSLNYTSAIHAEWATLDISNTIIAYNQSSYWGGGGLRILGGLCNITNSRIYQNSAYGRNSFLDIIKDPPDCDPGCDPYYDPECIPCNMYDEMLMPPEHGYGGGIFIIDGAVVGLVNCLVSENYVSGGCDTEGSGQGASGFGGGVYVGHGSTLYLEHCTIANNGATWCDDNGINGEGIGGGVCSISEIVDCVTLDHCIVWGNWVTDWSGQTVSSQVDAWCAIGQFNDIEGGTPSGVTSYLSADPLFTAGLFGDYYLSSLSAGDATDSDCIDAGDINDTDPNLHIYTTTTDNAPDFGVVDLGYHYPIPEQPQITLTTPNGGETWIAGNEYPIKWESSQAVTQVKLEYTIDGINWLAISPPNEGNFGIYEWRVPQVDSEQCQVRAFDYFYTNTSDISNEPFTVFTCHLTTDVTDDCFVDMTDFVSLASSDWTMQELVNIATEWLSCGNPFDPEWCWD